MTQKVKTKFEGFPKVFKGNGLVAIIYTNHVEFYRKESQYYDQGDNPFDPWNEVQMAKGNGMNRVHCTKEIQVIDFTKRGTQ